MASYQKIGHYIEIQIEIQPLSYINHDFRIQDGYLTSNNTQIKEKEAYMSYLITFQEWYVFISITLRLFKPCIYY